MNFLRTDVICMRNVLKYHSAKDPGKVDLKKDREWDCYITACHFTAGSLFLSDGVLFAQSICSGTSVGTVF